MSPLPDPPPLAPPLAPPRQLRTRLRESVCLKDRVVRAERDMNDSMVVATVLELGRGTGSRMGFK